MKCFYCNSSVIWQSDFDTEDYGMEEEGIVSIFICPECNTEYETIRWLSNER